MSLQFLVDAAYVDPPASATAESNTEYVTALYTLATLVQHGVVRPVTTQDDMDTVLCDGYDGRLSSMRILQMNTASETASPDDARLVDVKSVETAIRVLYDQSVRCGLPGRVENLVAESRLSPDPAIQEVYTGCIPGSRDRAIASGIIIGERGVSMVGENSIVVPAKRWLNVLVPISYDVIFDDDQKQVVERIISGKSRCHWPLISLLRHVGATQLWMAAQNDGDREFAILVETEGRYGTAASESPPCHEWSFLERNFVKTAVESGATREHDKASELLKAMAATIASDPVQGGKHELRTGSGPGNPQQVCGDYRGWRRKCGAGLWLMWWESPRRVVFATVSDHHDDAMRLPAVSPASERRSLPPILWGNAGGRHA